MKLKSILVAAALAVSAGGALAEDIDVSIPLIGSASASFGTTHDVAGSFMDVFNFGAVPIGSLIDGSLVTSGFTAAQNITFTQASINGTMFTMSPTGAFEYGSLAQTPFTGGDLILTVWGTAGNAASYAGTINVNMIPEPATYGMLLGGLALVGLLARRRKQH